MSIRNVKNISISKYESFLELAGFKFLRTKGGHNIYSRSDATRPVVFQTHINPVPERIIKQVLKTFNYSTDDFHDILEEKKIVKLVDNTYILQ